MSGCDYQWIWEGDKNWHSSEGEGRSIRDVLSHGYAITGLEDNMVWVFKTPNTVGPTGRIRFNLEQDYEERFLQEMMAAKWREEHKEKGQTCKNQQTA